MACATYRANNEDGSPIRPAIIADPAGAATDSPAWMQRCFKSSRNFL